MSKLVSALLFSLFPLFLSQVWPPLPGQLPPPFTGRYGEMDGCFGCTRFGSMPFVGPPLGQSGILGPTDTIYGSFSRMPYSSLLGGSGMSPFDGISYPPGMISGPGDITFPYDRFGSMPMGGTGGSMPLGGFGGSMPFGGFGSGFSSGGLGSGMPFGSLGGGFGSDSMSANAVSLLSDKENFQVKGCSFDAVRNRCYDHLNICKGGCKDFGTGVAHDCRCIPYAIIALFGYTAE